MNKKVRFWEENATTQSSKRLAFLCIVAFALALSSVYLFAEWDYVGTIAIFGGLMTPALSLVGIGKKQENDRAKIEKEK